MRNPKHIDIELTNQCNLSCGICPHPKMTRPQGKMYFDLLVKIGEEANDMGIKTSYLHQIGEPLLYPHLKPAINYIARCGIFTSISTNCMLLDKRTDDILSSKLDEITLCLDSMDKEVLTKIRQRINYDKVIDNIDTFLEKRLITGKKKPFVTLQLIKMKDNINQVEKLKSIYQERLDEFPGQILIKDFSTFGGFVEDKSPNKAPPLRFKCNKAFTHLTINWDGTAVLCCRDYDKMAVIGDASKERLIDIWNGERMNYYRNQFKTKDWSTNTLCRNC